MISVLWMLLCGLWFIAGYCWAKVHYLKRWNATMRIVIGILREHEDPMKALSYLVRHSR